MIAGIGEKFQLTFSAFDKEHTVVGFSIAELEIEVHTILSADGVSADVDVYQLDEEQWAIDCCLQSDDFGKSFGTLLADMEIIAA